jgi:hypothetical protein
MGGINKYVKPDIYAITFDNHNQSIYLHIPLHFMPFCFIYPYVKITNIYNFYSTHPLCVYRSITRHIIPRVLKNPKFHYRAHKNQPSFTILETDESNAPFHTNSL